MRRNWWMCSTEGIRERLDEDLTGGVGLEVLRGFDLGYFLMDLTPVQIASAQVVTTTGEMSCGGGVSPCIESAVMQLIGH